MYSLKLPLLTFDSKKVSDSFAWAFFTKKMKYTPELVYDHPKVKKCMNNPTDLEPKL